MSDLTPFESWTQKSFEKVSTALKAAEETNRNLKESLEVVLLRLRNLEEQLNELKFPNRGVSALKPLDPVDGGV